VSNLALAVWRQVSGVTSTIKTVYVGALTVYSVIGTSFLHGWANVAAVAVILVLVPASVVLFHTVTAPADPVDKLLRTPAGARAPLEDEIGRAEQQGRTTWWADSSPESRWFDGLFAFWWKARGVPADTVRIVLDSPPLTAATFAGVPAEEVVPQRPDRKKAALVRASTFLSDVPPTLSCAPLDYELHMWVDHNGRAFRQNNSEASLFGVDGWETYPGLLCTHNVLMTSDHWLLLCLRSARTDFFPNSWSLSFEEQVEVGDCGTSKQEDASVGDTVRRGVRQEFGEMVSQQLRQVTLLALGRENSDTETRSVRSAAAVTVAELASPLAHVWRSLSKPGWIQDMSEGTAWMAWRFSDRRDVVSVLRRFPPGHSSGITAASIRNNHRLAVEVQVSPASSARLNQPGGFGWHPTSRARLLLWSEWAVAVGLLRDSRRLARTRGRYRRRRSAEGGR
jgi:hypothetical protein